MSIAGAFVAEAFVAEAFVAEAFVAGAFMLPHPPLIVPDVGRGEEKKIEDTVCAYREAAKRIGEIKPETIVLISPHQTMYADYFHISPGKKAEGDLGQFRAGGVKTEVWYDTEFVEKLCRLADIRGLPAGTMGEREKKLDHGTMVPLYFVEQYWKEYRLVRIGLSGLPLIRHYELGQCIQRAAEALDRKTVLIGSGDLSHRLKEDGPYGYREEGPAYDRRIMDVMGRAAFGELLEFSEDFCEKAGECGHRSFTRMAGALDRIRVEAEVLSYEGPFGVGYGICCFAPCGGDPGRNFGEQHEEKERKEMRERRAKEDAYVSLARKTIEEYKQKKKRIPPVKVDLSIGKFNYLIEMLTRYTTSNNEKISETATKLKEKLLRYSIPRVTEEQETFVDIRFYPNEASEIIYMLLVNTEDIEIETNYYEVLVNARESLKQDNSNNE